MNIMNCGYFSRKLNLLTIDTVLDPDPNSDCGTTKLLKYHVDDEESLLRIEGMYYKTREDSSFLLNAHYDDLHLIGEDIYLRSPIYCKGNRICSKCYGKLAGVNRDINIGVIGSTTISRPFTQNNLSAKHSLQTHSQEIKLTEGYEKYFSLEGNQLIINKDEIENDKLFLTIYSKDIDIETDTLELCDLDDEEMIKNEETVSCSTIYITSQDIHDIKFILKEDHDITLNSSEYLLGLIDKYKKNNKIISIPFKHLDDEEFLGSYDVENHELNKTLIETKNLLEKEEHADCKTIEELVYKFNRLLIRGKIYSHLVHTQVIIRNLIRSRYDILERPDFENDEPYKILTVQKALMNHPSALISVSYERLKEQFRNTITFRKSKASLIDILFMEKIMDTYEEIFDNMDIKQLKKELKINI